MPFYRLFLIAWTLCVAVVFVMPGLLLHDDWQRLQDRKLAATFPSRPDAGNFKALRRAYGRAREEWYYT